MSCKKINKVMSGYLDGELQGHELLEFEMHIDKCPKCAAELNAMGKIVACLGQMKVDSVPVSCWAGVREHIQTTDRRWYGVFVRPMVYVPALATSIIALVLLTNSIVPAPVVEQNNRISNPEYCRYISAHSQAQRSGSLSDPDVAFVAAELEKASLTTMDTTR